MNLAPQSPVRQGDILIRPKKSGGGYHYGTGLSNGLVKDNTPERGSTSRPSKALGTACQDGSSAQTGRRSRTGWLSSAPSNVGDPYHFGADNCEHDMTFAHGHPKQSDREHNPRVRRASGNRRPHREPVQTPTKKTTTVNTLLVLPRMKRE